MSSYDDGGGWAPYVSVAERRRMAERMLAKLKKKGRICAPVVIEGRAIARTFWGKSWCEHLENYSDYASRLPRGRTYARNGSIVDLQIATGKVSALVAGSAMYEVAIDVHPVDQAQWQAILDECAGQVASLVELLQGKLSNAVMDVVVRHGTGLFPVPAQIRFRCSCPDSASMCKHVAATLYGVGARFDSEPELLFRLRGVDPEQLIRQAGKLPTAQAGAGHDFGDVDLSALFGIDLGTMTLPDMARPSPPEKATERTKEKTVEATTKKTTRKTKDLDQDQAPTITSRQLGARGIPPYMRQNWLASGVLLRTEQRAVYALTDRTEPSIARYLSRKMQ
jgi:uncharacterized Zn finger protein